MRRIVLTDTQENQKAFVNDTNRLNGLVGQTAVAQTVLRPAGMVAVNGETFDAITDGAFVNKGETTTVVQVRGNYLVVR